MSYSKIFSSGERFSSDVKVELVLFENSQGHTEQAIEIHGSAHLDRQEVLALIEHLQELAEHL